MDTSDWKIRIIILESGYIKVALCPEPDGHIFWLPYASARTIRRWGTTKGLAELVNGPTTDTVLDAMVKSGKCPVRAIIDILDVEQSKWEKHLNLIQKKSKTSTHQTG